MLFANRAEAGARLAERLQHFRGADVVVLGLPRGGVPVAFEVARALGAPLDVIVVRKLGFPVQPELAMGAIGEGGVRVIDRQLVGRVGVGDQELAAVEARERAELERRARRFRGRRPRARLAGRIAIVVDDGIATGSTARAACQVARAQGAAHVVLATPLGAAESIAALRSVADDVVCLETPDPFIAIGRFYNDFSQTPDEEVIDLLATGAAGLAAAHSSPPVAVADPPVRDEDVEIHAGPRLAGHLTVPEQALGAVVFAHGSGSGRHSPRNRYVAGVLNRARLATLLFDLLTADEERVRANVFDIDLLAHRLVHVAGWLRAQPKTADLPIGYFGASTGAAAALVAAAQPGAEVAAVVSRGGRPDLAGRWLDEVHVPTLLIVGGHDDVVLGLNRRAQMRLHGESRVAVVPGATHLFEEPGALPAVADLARQWFVGHLAPRMHHAV